MFYVQNWINTNLYCCLVYQDLYWYIIFNFENKDNLLTLKNYQVLFS